ncbi:hypothetical protein [Pseudomonas fragi]|uniref:hypothetical protein n=1 Tax=Pseudomonas fragi TaxID=296 RepID=UPI001140214A|nr:hypothetical protein [Pseudomonas fragi]
MRTLEKAAKDIDHFQREASGFGAAHIETQGAARVVSKWRIEQQSIQHPDDAAVWAGEGRTPITTWLAEIQCLKLVSEIAPVSPNEAGIDRGSYI